MTKKQIRKATPTGVREVLPNGDIRNPTPADHLKILEGEYARVKKALLAKRAQLGLESVEAAKEERAAFLDAFTLGDDLDDERAVRAAGLLLEWGFGVNAGVGDGDDKDSLARGIAGTISLVADGMAMDRRRIRKVADELARMQGKVKREQHHELGAELDFLAEQLRER